MTPSCCGCVEEAADKAADARTDDQAQEDDDEDDEDAAADGGAGGAGGVVDADVDDDNKSRLSVHSSLLTASQDSGIKSVDCASIILRIQCFILA